MTRALRIQYKDAFYYATARGNDRRVIVRDDDYRGAFVAVLAESASLFGMRIHTWALIGK